MESNAGIDKEKDKDAKNAYRLGRMTLLELMAVLAVLGILITWVLRHFYA